MCNECDSTAAEFSGQTVMIGNFKVCTDSWEWMTPLEASRSREGHDTTLGCLLATIPSAVRRSGSGVMGHWKAKSDDSSLNVWSLLHESSVRP